MIEIASSLWRRCRLLILDEPTAALTDPEVHHLFDQVRRLRAEGVAILVVEQFARVVLEVADHAVVLAAGRVVATGTPADLEGSLAELYLGSGR